ncbi:metal-dependent membrane protease [Levilactobacillus paucivorans]|uniref:Metal-dependent membrane protease n=1 Tax=Levilactobacillus paucivorans TaxID=616990 RepID=A0A0R2LES1_9LACO|nr:metal-dependent membrane protease [Levilactobacillus paucivorans]
MDIVNSAQKQNFINIGWFLVMLILVTIVQIPLAFLSRGASWQRGLWAVVYAAGFLVAIAIGLWIYRRIVPGKWQRLTGQDWRLMVKGYVFMMVVEMSLNIVNMLVFKETSTKNNDLIATILGKSPLSLIMLSLTAVLASPVLEELTFRGILVSGCFSKERFWLPIVASGIVFSLVHQSDNLISWLIYAIMGGTFAYVYRKTGKLQTTIFMHGFNNLIAMLLMVTTIR